VRWERELFKYTYRVKSSEFNPPRFWGAKFTFQLPNFQAIRLRNNKLRGTDHQCFRNYNVWLASVGQNLYAELYLLRKFKLTNHSDSWRM
jgi:hypothetical protein